MPLLLVPMLTAFVSALVPVDDGIHDIHSLVATIEALQHPIEDFRCEYEGATVHKGSFAEKSKQYIDENGQYNAFGGVFIWKREGEVRIDMLRGIKGKGNVSTDKIMIRPKEGAIEHHNEPGGRGIGSVGIREIDKGMIPPYTSPLLFFLLDRFKAIRDLDQETRTSTVTDGELDGRPVKILTVYMIFKGTDVADKLIRRYWIDLHRSGHAVRLEAYMNDMVSRRSEITLKSFQIDEQEVWMPVAMDTKGYFDLDAKGQPFAVASEPTSETTIMVVDRTMEFNKHPGPEVFTTKYKPGTPISDHIRKLQYQYGQDKIKPQPTRSEIEAMLDSQLAKAEVQKNELVAAPLSEGFNWWALSVTGLGAAMLASLTLLWMQRRAG